MGLNINRVQRPGSNSVLHPRGDGAWFATPRCLPALHRGNLNRKRAGTDRPRLYRVHSPRDRRVLPKPGRVECHGGNLGGWPAVADVSAEAHRQRVPGQQEPGQQEPGGPYTCDDQNRDGLARLIRRV